jgi:hypothetical protein
MSRTATTGIYWPESCPGQAPAVAGSHSGCSIGIRRIGALGSLTGPSPRRPSPGPGRATLPGQRRRRARVILDSGRLPRSERPDGTPRRVQPVKEAGETGRALPASGWLGHDLSPLPWASGHQSHSDWPGKRLPRAQRHNQRDLWPLGWAPPDRLPSPDAVPRCPRTARVGRGRGQHSPGPRPGWPDTNLGRLDITFVRRHVNSRAVDTGPLPTSLIVRSGVARAACTASEAGRARRRDEPVIPGRVTRRP